jgi:hypothetical protein
VSGIFGPGSNVHVVTSNTTVTDISRQIYDLVGNGTAMTFIGGGGNDVNVMGASEGVSLDNTAGMRVDDSGKGMNLILNGSNGVFLSDFQFDKTGSITIRGSDYANARAAVSHIVSDGNGGSLLSLGSAGSIDFVGDTHVRASQIHISHS